jgi:general secretion pathway protein C
VIAWSARSEPPRVAPRPVLSATPSVAAPAGDVAFAGEKAYSVPTSRPPGPVHAAASLPRAERGPKPSPPSRPGNARCGGLEARLISVGDDPEWTFASIAPGPAEPARLTRVGDRIGSYRIAAIEWDKVWVQAGGPRCALELNPGLAKLADSGAAPPWQVPEAITDAIDKRSETEYRISRTAVASIFEQGTALLGGVRLVPHESSTNDAAIEFETVPGDSLLDRLGVQSGDLLIALNGAACKTPRGALEALLAARDRDRLLARLERAGEGFEIELRIE